MPIQGKVPEFCHHWGVQAMDVDEIPVTIGVHATVEAGEFLWNVVAFARMIPHAPERELESGAPPECVLAYQTWYS